MFTERIEAFPLFVEADLDRLVVLWRTLEVLGNVNKQNKLSTRIEQSGLTEAFIARSLGLASDK